MKRPRQIYVCDELVVIGSTVWYSGRASDVLHLLGAVPRSTSTDGLRA